MSNLSLCGGISSLHFPQTNHILLAHIKQNGVTPSTKEVRVMSARTVLISGNEALITKIYDDSVAY